MIPNIELSLPIQNIDIANIDLGPLASGQKLISSISYTHPVSTMPSLSILLPIMPVHSYDPVTGHLILQIIDALHMKKLNSMQDHILKLIRESQKNWFPDFKSRGDDIRSGFQPMVEGNLLHVYCPLSTGGPYDIHVYNGEWSRSTKGMIKVGKHVRAVLRIQGVSFHQSAVTGAWTGKFRLQHRILTLYMVT
jgi:hypothetical protein